MTIEEFKSFSQLVRILRRIGAEENAAILERHRDAFFRWALTSSLAETVLDEARGACEVAKKLAPLNSDLSWDARLGVRSLDVIEAGLASRSRNYRLAA